MSRRLILVRHGQTTQNVAGIAQGWNDSELSELGRGQVQRLAERLASMSPTALYSSPLGRAMSTAEAIAAATGLEIVALEDLREMHYGGWEGRSFLDVRREDEELYQRWIADENATCPNGESHADVRVRMTRAFARVMNGGAAAASAAQSNPAAEAAAVPPERIIVVGHGTALRIGATALLNLPVMSANSFAQDNAAMNVFVQRRDGRWVLKHWNDTRHCE